MLLRPPHILVIPCMVWLLACGGKAKRDSLWWADKHDQSSGTSTDGQQTERRFGKLTKAEAAKRLRAELASADPRAVQVLVFANRLVKAGGALTPKQARRVRAMVDATDQEFLTLAWPELDRPHEPSRAVALRLALLAEHSGDPARARRMLGYAKGEPSLAAVVGKLERRLASAQKVDAGLVAVLLPLSGHYKKLGREMRLAIVVAAAFAPGTRLQFIDTKGEANRAAAAVDDAVFVHKASAIIGPVGQRESVAAARRAVALGIPIGLLAPATNGASPRDGVFRLWSSPEWEAREAARLAISLGYTKLAILAPRGDVGAAQARAFRLAAGAGRARVLRTGFYNPARTAIEKDIKAFLGLDPKTNRRLRRHLARRGWKRGWKSFSPKVPFDLLYIPDDYRRAALVASYMPFFNVEVRTDETMNIYHLRKKHGGRYPTVVQLFGSSGWHHPGLIPRGGKAVQGAMVIDLYSGSDTEEFAHEAGAAFAQAFRKRVGRNPGAVAAQTFDAASLMFKARAAAGKYKVKNVRAALAGQLRGRRFDGACGPALVNANGEIQRKAIMLRVDGGDFVPHAH